MSVDDDGGSSGDGLLVSTIVSGWIPFSFYFLLFSSSLLFFVFFFDFGLETFR